MTEPHPQTGRPKPERVELELADPTLHVLEAACRVLGVSWDEALAGRLPAQIERPAAVLEVVAPASAGGAMRHAEGVARFAAAAFFELAAAQLTSASRAVTEAYRAADMDEPRGKAGDLLALRRDLAAHLPADAYARVAHEMPVGQLFEWLGLRGLKGKLDAMQEEIERFRRSL